MTAAALALAEDGDLIARLRELTPHRPITWPEAHSIAERQAALLLDLWGISEPPVPQWIICNQPGIVVDWRTDWPTEATSFKTDRLWRVVIRSTDVKQRQRFSLAHEFKHVLDDPFIDRLMANLPVDQRQERAERLCNYFAACLLMPRPWIKHDWCSGLQNIAKLARRYYVSVESMTTRLSELGLTDMTLALEPRFGRHLPETT
jgi:Zn-dependent peptidase ImmA (M78 family)